MKWSYSFITILLLCRMSSAAEPIGLLIYCEPPTTYAEAVEYTEIERTSPIFSTIRRTDGKTMEVQSAGVLGYVPYPANSNHPGFDDEANAAQAKIDGFLAKYPQLQARLLNARARWRNALTLYTKLLSKQPATPAATAPAISKFTVDGQTYSAAALDSVLLDSVSISHSDGVTKIRLEKLSPVQIAALNGTSKTVQIPLDWKQNLAKALEAQRKAAELAAANPPPNPTTSAPQEANRSIASRSQPPTETPKGTGDDIDTEGNVAMPETLTESVDRPGYQETLALINTIIGPKQKLGFSPEANRMVFQSGLRNYLFDPQDIRRISHSSNEQTVVPKTSKYVPGQSAPYETIPADHAWVYAECVGFKDLVVVKISPARLEGLKRRPSDDLLAQLVKPTHSISFECAPRDESRLRKAVASLIQMCGGKLQREVQLKSD